MRPYNLILLKVVTAVKINSAWRKIFEAWKDIFINNRRSKIILAEDAFFEGILHHPLEFRKFRKMVNDYK